MADDGTKVSEALPLMRKEVERVRKKQRVSSQEAVETIDAALNEARAMCCMHLLLGNRNEE